MKNLKDILNLIFINRKDFKTLTDDEKTKWGFIVNRMLSKKYPEYAQKLNVRQGDWGMVLNLWWVYIGYRPDKYYYTWVWESGKKGKSKIDKKTIDLIHQRFEWLTIEDIEYLHDWYNDDFKEEIKYYKKLEEDYG